MPKSKIRIRVCNQCNKKYELGVDSTLNKYCSIRCRKDFHNSVWNSKYGNRDNKAQMFAWRLRTVYGITPEIYNQILESQNNACGICGIDKPMGLGWHVDHCHETGKVRGILCQKCNQALGLLNENINTMEKMIEYTKNHS